MKVKLAHCYICKQYKPSSEFHKDKSRVMGIMSQCKKCLNQDKNRNTAYLKRKHIKRLPHIRIYSKKYYYKFTERVLARNLVCKALKSGRLTKQPCRICGSTKNVQGHHKDYSKPLKVIWLCKPHHWQADRHIIKV